MPARRAWKRETCRAYSNRALECFSSIVSPGPAGKGGLVHLSRILKRLLSGDHTAGAADAIGNLVAWVFIAIVALFLTQPSGGPFSAPGMQVPWPTELGLETGGPGP